MAEAREVVLKVSPEVVRKTLKKRLSASIKVQKAQPSEGQRQWMYSVAK